jgi:hypothetical protein
MLTSVLMAVVVCVRASALTSAISFGLPPGIAAMALLKRLEIADHASNWLILKGTLGVDKLRLLQEWRLKRPR